MVHLQTTGTQPERQDVLGSLELEQLAPTGFIMLCISAETVQSKTLVIGSRCDNREFGQTDAPGDLRCIGTIIASVELLAKGGLLKDFISCHPLRQGAGSHTPLILGYRRHSSRLFQLSVEFLQST